MRGIPCVGDFFCAFSKTVPRYQDSFWNVWGNGALLKKPITGQTGHLSTAVPHWTREELPGCWWHRAGRELGTNCSPDRVLCLFLSIDSFQDFDFVFPKHVSPWNSEASRLVAVLSQAPSLRLGPHPGAGMQRYTWGLHADFCRSLNLLLALLWTPLRVVWCLFNKQCFLVLGVCFPFCWLLPATKTCLPWGCF